ncbi:Maf family protein [Marinicellulosiphila megalodicopiae]|uniref:Maf family protein n=1 Tax=Marinicellulosiphila megalodicopiae TaxID=2724896 RepID=UPI003BB20A3C
MTLILASSSPRRKQMLTQLGYQFECLSPYVDESRLVGENAINYVERIAIKKGEHVFNQIQNSTAAVILASDTIVCFENEILLKPENYDVFRVNMQKLSDNWHQVITSVYVKSPRQTKLVTVTTNVKFRNITVQEIQNYWHTGEPLDKAGGYAIQGIGAGFVESIEGSYSSVVGLPLTQTIALLRQFDIDYLS